MKNRHALWAMTLLGILFFGEGGAAAVPFCTVEDAMRDPEVQRALDEWQVQNRGWIEPSVRTSLALDFCNAALEIRSEKSVPDIVGATAGALQRFLRPYLTEEPGQSMIDALRNQLGREGAAQPVPRALGTIIFTYVRRVDALSVRGSSISPVERVIVSPGSAPYAGYSRRRVRCSGTVDVVAGRTIPASC